MLKLILVSMMGLGSTVSFAQGLESSERALVDAVTSSTQALCEQFQVNIRDAEVQERLVKMFGHLGLTLQVTDCESLGVLVGLSFEIEDLKAWALLGPGKLNQVKAEYSLLISQLSKRQFGKDSHFRPMTQLELFEIVLLKGFYDGVKRHLVQGN